EREEGERGWRGIHLEGAQRHRAQRDPLRRAGGQGEPYEVVLRPGSARQPDVRKATRLGEPCELGDLRRRAPAVQDHPDLHRLKIRFRLVSPSRLSRPTSPWPCCTMASAHAAREI